MNIELPPFYIPLNRRRFFKAIALASAGFTLPGYMAEALTLSPTVTQGPYYPLADDIPLDKDNDLVQLGNNTTIAGGIVTTFTGRVLTSSGVPVKNALVELWHADREGDYVYSAGAGRNAACDANFAGFRQFLTGSTGAFKFRTVKAGLYNGRTRHTHFGVTLPGRTTRTTTQTFWNETALSLTGTAWATQNSNDMVFSGITDAAQRASVLLNFTPVAGTTTGEVETTWDYVSGFTPSEPTYPAPGGFLYQGTLVAGPGTTKRFKISVPAYSGYTYEIYANPTLADLAWKALPFSLTATGTLDRHKHAATANGTLDFYTETAADYGFDKVSFRVPGANAGVP